MKLFTVYVMDMEETVLHRETVEDNPCKKLDVTLMDTPTLEAGVRVVVYMDDMDAPEMQPPPRGTVGTGGTQNGND